MARLVTSPWSTMLYPSPLSPASARTLRISVALDGLSPILKDEIGSPFLFSLTDLVKDTSSSSILSLLLPSCSATLAKTRVTDICLAAFPLPPPLKISSETFEALSALVDLGPKTNCMASPELDLPLPLGPVIAVNPLSKGITISPPNDLKFSTSILFRCIPSP